jgi:hypothetical protein
MVQTSWDCGPEQILLTMKNGLSFDHAPPLYSGTTAPELYRLLRFSFAATSSVVVAGSSVKAWPNGTW